MFSLASTATSIGKNQKPSIFKYYLITFFEILKVWQVCQVLRWSQCLLFCLQLACLLSMCPLLLPWIGCCNFLNQIILKTLFRKMIISIFRDRLRTSINVLGDAYGCGIVAHLSRNELKKIDDEAEQETEKLLAHRSHELSPSHTKPFLNGGAEKSDHPYQSSASHNEENPSLIGMNSYSRNSPKIPLSVTSMPQISVFQSPSFENQDSTV